MRRAAGVDFPVAVLHPGQADRRQDQRQRGRLAENGGRGIAPGDIDEDALAQLDRLQILTVGAQRFLGIGTAVAIIEKCLWHFPHVALPQILDAGNVFHGRIPAPPNIVAFAVI